MKLPIFDLFLGKGGKMSSTRDFQVEIRSDYSSTNDQFGFLCEIHSKREIDSRDSRAPTPATAALRENWHEVEQSAGVAVGLDCSIKHGRYKTERQLVMAERLLKRLRNP